MPFKDTIEVELPDKGIVLEFPPDATEEEINSTIDRDVYGEQPKEPFSVNRLLQQTGRSVYQGIADISRTLRAHEEILDIKGASRALADKEQPYLRWLEQSGEIDLIPDKLQDASAEEIEVYLQNDKDRNIKAYKDFESKLPKLMPGSSGMVEDAVAGMARFLPSMGISAVSPMTGIAVTYAQIVGSKQQEYQEKGVDPETAYVASNLAALAETPIEFAGNLIQIGAIKNLGKSVLKNAGKSRAVQFLTTVAENAAAEGAEEYLQQYPDEIANYYAENPDIPTKELAEKTWNSIGEIHKNAVEAGKVGALGGAILAGAAGAVTTPAMRDYKFEEQKEVEQGREEKQIQRESTDFLKIIKSDLEAGNISADELREQRLDLTDDDPLAIAVDQALEDQYWASQKAEIERQQKEKPVAKKEPREQTARREAQQKIEALGRREEADQPISLIGEEAALAGKASEIPLPEQESKRVQARANVEPLINRFARRVETHLPNGYTVSTEIKTNLHDIEDVSAAIKLVDPILKSGKDRKKRIDTAVKIADEHPELQGLISSVIKGYGNDQAYQRRLSRSEPQRKELGYVPGEERATEGEKETPNNRIFQAQEELPERVEQAKQTREGLTEKKFEKQSIGLQNIIYNKKFKTFQEATERDELPFDLSEAEPETLNYLEKIFDISNQLPDEAMAFADYLAGDTSGKEVSGVFKKAAKELKDKYRDINRQELEHARILSGEIDYRRKEFKQSLEQAKKTREELAEKAEKPPKAKDPWEMTLDEFSAGLYQQKKWILEKLESDSNEAFSKSMEITVAKGAKWNRKFRTIGLNLKQKLEREAKKLSKPASYYLNKHRKIIKQALSEGKPVPKEVLAEYPDLQKKPKTPKPKQKPQEAPVSEPAAEKPKPIGTAWVGNQWKPILEAKEIKRGKSKGKFRVSLIQKTSSGNQKTVIVPADAVRLTENIEFTDKQILDARTIVKAERKVRKKTAKETKYPQGYAYGLLEKQADTPTSKEIESGVTDTDKHLWWLEEKPSERSEKAVVPKKQATKKEAAAFKEKTEKAPVIPKKEVSASKNEISYQLAYDAHRGISFVPEKRAVQEQEEYVNYFNRAKEQLEKLVKTDEERSLMNSELKRYKEGLQKHYNALLHAKSRTMSAMIAGPSNFPTARNKKRIATEDKRRTEFLEWDKKARAAMAKKIRPERYAISSDQADAVELLEKKIADAEKLQNTMKGVNKIARSKKLSKDEKIEQIKKEYNFSNAHAEEILKPDYMGREGFAPFELQNNNANIRRMKERVENLKKQRSQDTSEIEFDGGTIVDNVEDNRLQILFDGKPDAEIRKKLKSRGFRWAPSVKAWQRYRSPEAMRIAKEIVGAEEKTPEVSKVLETIKSESGEAQILSDLSAYGADLIRNGYDRFNTFRNEMKRIFGEVWDKIKTFIRKAFVSARKIVENERGEIKIREGKEEQRKEYLKRLKDTPEYKEYQEKIKEQSPKQIIQSDDGGKFLKEMRQRFGKGYVDDDMKWYNKAFENPQSLARKFKSMFKAFHVELDAAEQRSEELYQDYVGKLGENQQDYNKLSPKQKTELKNLIWKWDGVKFPKSKVSTAWAKIGGEDEDIEINPKHYDEMESFLQERGATPEVIDHFLTIRKKLDEKWVDADKTMRTEIKDGELIREFRSVINRLPNYFPHRRVGNVHASAYDQEGNAVYREHFNSVRERWFRRPGNKARQRVKKWLEKEVKAGRLEGHASDYRIKVDKVKKLPDEVFFQIPVEQIQQIVAAAGRQLESERVEYEAQRMTKKGAFSTVEEAREKIRKQLRKDMEVALSNAVSDIFKSRGWAGHSISRRTGKGIPGHETDDIYGILFDYLSGYAGFKTKIIRAKQHSKILMDIDASNHPEEYRYTSAYVRDMLANQDSVDRAVDTVRGLFFVKYLGFVVKSGFVNLTQNAVLAAPILSVHTKNAHLKLSKAMKDTRRALTSKAAWTGKEVGYPGLKKDEQRAISDLHEAGASIDQFLRELKGDMPGIGWGKYFKKYVNTAGIFMGLAEKFNRTSTGLAAFRVAKEKGMNYGEAVEFAKQIIYDAHFVYGKHNLPSFARGSTPGKLMRSGYTFRSFSHNYLLVMAHMLKNQGWQGRAAAARSLRNVILLGGLVSFPFFKAFSEALMWALGKDDEDLLTNIRAGMPNKYLRDLVTYGLPGVAGVDVSGSLSIEIPRNWVDIIGVPYAAYEDTVNMVKSLKSGQTFRALSETPFTPINIRNAMRGMELYTKGQRTRSGRAINAPGKTGPRKITGAEAVAKGVLGFQPTAMSKGYGAYRALQKSSIVLDDKKKSFADRYVNALQDGNKQKQAEIAEELRKWNEKQIRLGKPHMVIDIRGMIKSRMRAPIQMIPKNQRFNALRMSEAWQ